MDRRGGCPENPCYGQPSSSQLSGVFISRDGRTIVGCVNDAEHNMGAGIWQGGQNWSDNIGSLGGKAQDGILTSPYAISGDGSIIVGSSQTPDGKRHAFRWDAKNGMVDLGAMTGEGTTGFSRINGISPDGRVLVGWDEDKGLPAMGGYQQWRGAIWWRGAERLVHPMGWAGEAVVTNSNGSLIAGYGHPASVQTAWLYSAWDGKLYDLGALGEPGSLFDKSFPLAMSDDGLVIVGYCGTNPATVACIWTPDTGMMGLLEYLTARNVAGIEDWTRLAIATAITPDGKVIGGTGVNKNVQGTPSFIVTLP